MATTIKLVHVSHSHPLMLIEDFDSSSVAAPLVCCLCETPVIGLSPAYTCSQEHSPCLFFLHKRCAESAKFIKHFMHPEHQLDLRKNYQHTKINWLMFKVDTVCFFCAACTREINPDMWVFYCKACEPNSSISNISTVTCSPFVLCARCVVLESVLDHEGHKEHPLTLLSRRACFSCDACGIEAAESDSYICLACRYWIHSSCAAYPGTIKLRIHEDDTLKLLYSVPKMYQKFIRHCSICKYEVKQKNWAYFCEESGYFVHITCAANLLASGKNVIKVEGDDEQKYPDLMQFPRYSTDSLVADFIAVLQSGKLMNNNSTIEEEVDKEKESPLIFHWSHWEHPLILLKELKKADDSDDDGSDTNNRIDEMLVCNGCVQPISTASNKYYYGCIRCNYFLHTLCANHLPLHSPPGRCTLHPGHTLKLEKYYPLLLDSQICKACCRRTNGFTYKCDTCPSLIDICCCLTPHRIKHESHKHPLVQRYATSENTCNACLMPIGSGFEYGCETCSDVQIHQICALKLPKKIYHRWDSHSISLIYPPIYYKGLRYCEICELEVNQEAWLYRCSECDQCFHPLCIRQPHNVKLGNKLNPSTHTFHPHTLTLRMIDKSQYPERLHKYLSCRKKNCRASYFGEQQQLYLECAGCNYLICVSCADLRLSL